MASIYSRAALTIAASASHDSRGGCFRPTPELSGSNSWEIGVEYKTLDDGLFESSPKRKIDDTDSKSEDVRWFNDDEMADYWERWKSGGQVRSTFGSSGQQFSTMRYLPGHTPPASLPSRVSRSKADTKISEINKDRNKDAKKQWNQAQKPPNFLGKLESMEHSTGVYVRELLSHQEFASNRNSVRPTEQPLSSRAWVLQERLLSTRILHFTSSELVWECKSESYCQCGLVGCDAQWGAGADPTSTKSLKLAFDHAIREASGADPGELNNIWSELIKIYTSKSMSHKTDRLPAASGLIQRLQQANAGECFAGMWRKYLTEHMTWHLYPSDKSVHVRHETYVAPTWSWASVTAHVYFRKSLVSTAITGLTVPKPNMVAEILDVQYTLAGLDPTGSLSDGVLTIRAPVLSAELLSSRRGKREESPCRSDGKKFVFEIRHPRIGDTVEFVPDSVSDIDTSNIKQDVLCVQWTKQVDPQPVVAQLRALGWRKRSFDLASHFLVLRQSTKRPDKYERVGLVTFYTVHTGPDYRPSDQQFRIEKWFQGACVQTLDLI